MKLNIPILSVLIMLVGCSSQIKTTTNTSTSLKYTQFVDPFIGTDGHGHTFPGATVPFGMVQLSPDTGIEGWDWCSGYHASDSSVMGFSHTHLSGTGGGDYGDILLMPTVGEIKTEPGTKANPDEGYRSRFDKAEEKASAGYYSVNLKDYGIQAELTSTTRVGVHRYTFPKSDDAHIILDLKHGISDSPRDTWFEVTSENEIVGLRKSSGWARDQYVYFVAQFSKPFASVAGDREGELLENVKKLEGEKGVKAVLNFNTEENEPIVVKVAISAVSVDGARKNLNAEVTDFDFDRVQKEAERTWNTMLSKIETEGGSKEQNTVFYTALYHSMIAPNVYMDVDHQYRGMDQKIHTATGFTNHTLFSLWDTFRSTHPLFTLVAPEQNNDFIKSMIAKYEQYGQLPIWELSANETGTMIGFHSVPVIVDAFLKGQTNFDPEIAYEAIVAAAEDEDRGLYWFNKEGFIPREKESNSVSKQVEYAYDMWCVAQMAKALGKTEDFEKYSKRATYYKNLFDAETGFIRSKDMYGVWAKDFDPMAISLLGAGDYTEGNAWHYNFFAPQDVNGLMALHGGDEKFAKLIDEMFLQEAVNDNHMAHDVTGLIGQYAQGNEPSHHVIYLYNFAGQPWKTQERIRQVMNEMYTAERDGLSGNEDCGQMSAWYVYSAMGFYPVNPANGEYIIGSPIFPKVTIHMDNGNDFVIEAPKTSDEAIYIQSAKLNGENHPMTMITHEQIEKGGILSFDMATAKSDWGTALEARPTSFAILPSEADQITDDEPYIFRPYVTNESLIFNAETTVELKNVIDGVEIFYTLDGSTPTTNSTTYTNPFEVTSSTLVKAIAVDTDGNTSAVADFDFKNAYYNTGDTFPSLSINYKKHPSYYSGTNGLIDGVYASDNLRDGKWDGISGQNFEAIVDLGDAKSVSNISIGFLENTGSWVFLPKEVIFSVSEDGENFTEVGRTGTDMPNNHPRINVRRFAQATAEGTNARYIKVEAVPYMKLPAWHPGAGNNTWMFTDEIVIEE
ncbi:GH92 family glycosyl hydrolase [Sediminitomix flava]|uniref:Putative alpha-1,2-mannosidase n=1 Tax=Sediminitomix flava TaxID=379075 RepID=A0A315ZA79_SEDFL|nr:GH92 family glycosyl hydrolase [Sediminitomix flava]PWJ42182.1 putative alpha-1,2-mannosidase [Sediminitomix flava]